MKPSKAHVCQQIITIIGSDNGLLPLRVKIPYLNQCWFIVKQKLRNILQWNLNKKSDIFFEANPFGKDVCKMTATILPRLQCVIATCLDYAGRDILQLSWVSTNVSWNKNTFAIKLIAVFDKAYLNPVYSSIENRTKFEENYVTILKSAFVIKLPALGF